MCKNLSIAHVFIIRFATQNYNTRNNSSIAHSTEPINNPVQPYIDFLCTAYICIYNRRESVPLAREALKRQCSVATLKM